MKRRVGIAQALLGDPKLVIVDEPTAGLDPEERIRVRNLLGEVSRSATVILSTHIVEDISHSCNDLAVISDGTVAFRGTPTSLIGGAKGKVWNILSRDDSRPREDLVVVSTLQLADGIQYRVLGDDVSGYQAASIEPSLEDGYMWLMRGIRAAA
jgi:ABC-type multidrug transport system ATPase subunit